MNCDCVEVHPVRAESVVPLHEHRWDRAGLWISALCLAHCLALPLIPFFAAAVVLPAWASGEALHPYFSVLAFLAAIPAAILGYRKHSSACIAGSVLLGSALVIGAGFFHGALDEKSADLAMIFGSATLLCAHAWNWRALRKQKSQPAR